VPLDAALLKALKVLAPARIGNLPGVHQGHHRQALGLLGLRLQGVVQGPGHLKRAGAVLAQGLGLLGGIAHLGRQAAGLLGGTLHLGGHGLRLLHHRLHMCAGAGGILHNGGQCAAGTGGLLKTHALHRAGNRALHTAVVRGGQAATKPKCWRGQMDSRGKAVPLGIKRANLPR
jgi:hypothetical protein